MKVFPAVRISYVFIISAIIFIFNSVYVTFGLLSFQILLWVLFKIPLKKLKPLKRIRSFVVVLLFFYSCFYGQNDFVLLTIKKWSFGINCKGFLLGLLMVSKLLTMLLATFIVRFKTSSQEFMVGLRSLGMSKDFALVLDGMLSTIEKTPKKDKKSKNKGDKNTISIKSILKGNFSSITDLISDNLNQARSNFSNNDIAVIAAFSMMVTLIRFVKIVPGFPIAPGHKNVLIIPFFILANRLTGRNFSATSIGFLSGIMHFVSGFGKYGPLGIIQFAFLGLVVDLLLFVFKKSNSVIWFGFIGLLAGFTRASSEILLAWLLRMPIEAFLFYIPYVISNGLFGMGSGIVSKYLVRKIK